MEEKEIAEILKSEAQKQKEFEDDYKKYRRYMMSMIKKRYTTWNKHIKKHKLIKFKHYHLSKTRMRNLQII